MGGGGAEMGKKGDNEGGGREELRGRTRVRREDWSEE